MVRPLFGSGRHGKATINLFQKHPLCWKQHYIVYRNGIASVKVKFCVLLEFILLKIELLQRNCRVPAGYETTFLKHTERSELCALCFHPDQLAS